MHGTLESSNPDVRDTLKLGLDETMNHQARTYEEMTNYGWYTISNIDSKKIKQTLKNIQNN